MPPMIPQLPHPDAIGAVRARASLFRAVDHETLPAALLGLAAVVVALVALVAVDGRTHLADGATLTPQAWLALAALAVLAVLGASEAGAWLLSRRVGRDLARTVARLERARGRVARIRVTGRGDVALDAAGERIEQARRDLVTRLAQLDSALATIARLPDARARAAQLELIRLESLAVDRAAGAYDAAARLVRSSGTSPWELSRDEAIGELTEDLDRAERLLRSA
jgi:hypothetical protein